jgi:hypothetical protein
MAWPTDFSIKVWVNWKKIRNCIKDNGWKVSSGMYVDKKYINVYLKHKNITESYTKLIIHVMSSNTLHIIKRNRILWYDKFLCNS